MTRLDLLLLLMVTIWGTNFSVIKFALREFPETAFNALRLALASLVFLAVMAVQRRHSAPDSSHPPAAPHPPHGSHLSHLTRSDWKRLFLLGVVGHLVYQWCFLAGVNRTTASNSSLIFGCSPVAIALLSSLAGHDRVSPLRWGGAALSLAGVYAVVGHGARLSGATVAGDALVFGGMLCWSAYSVLAQPLLRRHSPLLVTGISITIGAVLFAIAAIPSLLSTTWSAISTISWILMAASSLLALAFAYIVWYTAVQRIGSARTAVYSNLTPIVAVSVAAVWLKEPIGPIQLLGAIAILTGVFITRLDPPRH